jgi:hypothetical protein
MQFIVNFGLHRLQTFLETKITPRFVAMIKQKYCISISNLGNEILIFS